MQTGIRLKFSLKISQNSSKHTYITIFTQNHLSISIIFLQKNTFYFL